MIIFIHSIYFVIKFAIKLYKKHKALQNFTQITNGITKDTEELERFIEESLQFDPPVFRQRYAEVQQVLLDKRWRHEIKKVVDFGCAELGFFIYLKNLIGITEVLEVDFDIDVIENYKYKVQPLTADFLSRRSEPLKVEILCGSIGDPDSRLADTDAVVGIEIIEHLFPDTLEALPFNIFGYINPRIVIFTTPNADFNILFSNFKGFRHYDHKFEWTREQFQDWANNICARFPEYSVTFHGIGAGPKGTESLGSCSQMAVFEREYSKIHTEVPHDNDCCSRTIHKPEESYGICTYFSYTKQMKCLQDLRESSICDTIPEIVNNKYYKIVDSFDYPYMVDNRSADEKILQEATYIIYRNATYHSRYYNEDTDTVEIPLHELVHNFEGYFTTVEEIRDILIKAEFDVKECSLDGSNPCVIYPLSMDKQSTPNSSVKSEQEYNIDLSHEAESDWECDAKVKPEEENESPVEPSEQLFDSGYQKSISNAEWSPTSPLDGTFEDHFNSFLKLDVNDIKENMKAHNRKELLLKRINNRVYSERRQMIAGMSSSRKTPEPPPLPQAACSSALDKKKKRKGGKGRVDDKEDDVVQDLRMLADCIVYNSLNMVHVEAERVPEPRIIDAPVIIAIPEGEVDGLRYPAVENGDLANNNRDNEGNNYPDDGPPAPMNLDMVAEDENNANENLVIDDNAGELEAVLEQQDQQNQNDIPNELEGVPAPEQMPLVDYEEDESEAALAIEDPVVLNHASREALFDPDSQLDMLEDFPETQQAARDVEPVAIPVLIRVDQIADENIDIGAANDANPFPNWLLQLLGQQVEEQPEGNHDEPHFYCQGDGLGVHPSVIEVDVDDSTSSDSSSNDEAQAEQTLSEDDVGPLPADGNADQTLGIELVGQAMRLRASTSAVSNDSNDEFFDTIEDTNFKE